MSIPRGPMRDLEAFYVAFVAAMLAASALCAVCSAAAVKAAELVAAVMGGVERIW